MNAPVQPLPLVKGTLDMIVLKALSSGDLHGFEITSWIEEQSAGMLEFDDSAVYQALYRLERRKLVAARWGRTENNRQARYYRLTRAGEEHLSAETERLLRFADTMRAILRAPARPA
jgi:transcriptional regulator